MESGDSKFLFFFKCFTAHIDFNLCSLRGLAFGFPFWLSSFMGHLMPTATRRVFSTVPAAPCPAMTAATPSLLTHSKTYSETF